MPASPRRLTRLQREGLIGLLFLSPWILGFLLLKLVPILVALGFSFTNFEMLAPEQTRFVGLENYIRFLDDTEAGANLFGSVGYFIVTIPVQMAAALALAALFTSGRIKNRRILRTLFFMPSIIPAVAIYFIFFGMIDSKTGWINLLILEPLGLPPIQSLFAAGGYSLILTVFALWSIGPGFLIMLGAMQSIPKEIYEAARVDGAGPILRFFSITIPMITPAIFFALIVNLTAAFGGVALLDRGYLYSQSPSPMENYIADTIFSKGDLGYASALAWVMFAVTITITIAVFRSSRSWVYFPEENRDEDF
jgi:multiple sugar transport system permease protein